MNAEPGKALTCEFQHLRKDWYWMFLFGVLLVTCGTVAVVLPALTAVAAMMVLGVALMIAGTATLVHTFWAGKWSGLLLQLLVGVIYLMAGFLIFDTPVQAARVMTLFVTALFIVVGAYRLLAAMMVRFPHWGWALLNGAITLLLGLVIYRHFPQSAVWVLGLLLGLELLLHGWMWIMMSLKVYKAPA